ncbi:MAG TPA: RNA-binding protein [Firmicutes bacterium]|nr:RNA-binding protein [Bacillota bacterium]
MFVDAQLGQLVTSTAGRDSGRQFLIVGFNGNRILVADGDLRSVKRPKPKNLRHLCLHSVVAEEIRTKLAANIPVSDAEIRTALERLQDGGEEVDG